MSDHLYEDIFHLHEQIDRLSAVNERIVEENEKLRKVLGQIASEAKVANNVIRLNRDGGGNGRLRVATSMHRIERDANAALEAKP